MKYSRYVIFIVLLLIIIFHSCQKGREADRSGITRGGKAVIGLIGSITDLFPFTAREYYGLEISRSLLNPALTNLGADGTVYPRLASAWAISKNRLALTYIINGRYKWSNGQNISTSDVRATYNFLKNNLKGFNGPLNYGFISSVEVIDSLTVRFNFTTPVTDPLRRTRFAIFNHQQIGKADNLNELIKDFRKNFTGCGPFLLKKRDNKEIILKANHYYPGPGPYLDNLIIRIFPGIDSIAQALRKGQVDAAPFLPARYTELFKNQNYKKVTELEKGFEFIGWNLRRKRLQKVAIRKALTYALDRPTIIDGVLGVYAQIEDRPVLADAKENISHLNIPYDPKKAVQLFAQSGWIKNKKTGLLTKNKKTFKLNILTNTESEIRRELALNLQGYYRALGIKVKLEILPWDAVLKRLNSGDFDAVIISWRENGPYDILELFHSSYITNGSNFLAYKNKQADQLMEWALNTDNKDIREQTLLKLQQILMADQPITILSRQKLVNIISKKIHNIAKNGRSLIDSAKLWYFEN